MEKPYDLSVLAEGLKEDGVDVSEVAAGKVAKRLLAFFKESAAASENKVDDLVMGVVAQFEGAIDAAIDQINGKVGG